MSSPMSPTGSKVFGRRKVESTLNQNAQAVSANVRIVWGSSLITLQSDGSILLEPRPPTDLKTFGGKHGTWIVVFDSDVHIVHSPIAGSSPNGMVTASSPCRPPTKKSTTRLKTFALRLIRTITMIWRNRL